MDAIGAMAFLCTIYGVFSLAMVWLLYRLHMREVANVRRQSRQQRKKDFKALRDYYEGK